jgi:heme A synthase
MLNRDFSWATIGVLGLTAIIAIVGGAVVIWGHPGALSFDQYVNAMWKFALAAGVLGIGRGVKAGLENSSAASSQLTDVSLLSDIQGLVGGAGGNGQGQPDAANPTASGPNPVEVVSGHI